jgi:hypothetical protein
MAVTADEYRAKAEDALAQLADAKTEAERTRLKRAHGCFLKLASHDVEAAARSAIRPEGRIKPEKAPPAPARQSTSYFK